MTNHRAFESGSDDGKDDSGISNTGGEGASFMLRIVQQAMQRVGKPAMDDAALDAWLASCPRAAFASADGPMYVPEAQQLPQPPVNARKVFEWFERALDGIESALAPDELQSQTLALLESNAQEALLDLLGYSHFELVTEMLAKREAIVSAAADAKRSAQRRGETIVVAGARHQQTYEASSMEDIRSRLRSGVARGLRDTHSQLPNVFGLPPTVLQPPSLDGKVALPPDTVRTDNYMCEEYVFPPKLREHPDVARIRTVSISELPDEIRVVFPEYKTLNKMQSAVYNVAALSRENMLVAAPTGAGKTEVATMALARAAADAGPMNLRAVYVAPMKALAAEVTEKLTKRLRPLNLAVREYTGDMQLTRAQAASTHVLVTTPEKWDVAGRQAPGDAAIAAQVSLLIIDEVHLLQDDRGAVLEAIVARTLRAVERSQRHIRIVGLSATLPNYIDVATFLRVDPMRGLFVFGDAFRPVPLAQTLVGIKGRNHGTYTDNLDAYLFSKCMAMMQHKHQVLVFVHARNDTIKTAKKLLDDAREHSFSKASNGSSDQNSGGTHICTKEQHSRGSGRGRWRGASNRGGRGASHSSTDSHANLNHADKTKLAAGAGRPPRPSGHTSDEGMFVPSKGLFTETELSNAAKEVSLSRNADLKNLYPHGLGIHHAGMLRSDRSLVERLFEKGFIRVLVCTSTLAWGVNLPAHAVIIKGTRVFDSERGDWAQLSVLDVLQIFGRAGRPQYESSGDGFLLTNHEHLSKYMTALMCQKPIESHLLSSSGRLEDTLNAEVALGTVSSVADAVRWLKYTYLWVRLQRNPQAYGISARDIQKDPGLEATLQTFAKNALKRLAEAGMVSYSGDAVASRDTGRIAATHYLSIATIELWGKKLRSGMGPDEVLMLIASSAEFSNVRVRDEEMEELEGLADASCSPLVKPADITSTPGKVALLFQAYVSRISPYTQSLSADMHYVSQSAGRVSRALFEVLRAMRWTAATLAALEVCKCWERRAWRTLFHPLWQTGRITADVQARLEAAGSPSIQSMRKMNTNTLFELANGQRGGALLSKLANAFPCIDVNVTVHPILPSLVRLDTLVKPLYNLDTEVFPERIDRWWIFVDDPAQQCFVCCSQVVIESSESRVLVPLYVETVDLTQARRLRISIVSDGWLHAQETVTLDGLQQVPAIKTQGHVNVIDTCMPRNVCELKNPLLTEFYHTSLGSTFSLAQSALLDIADKAQSAVVGLCATERNERLVIAELLLWKVLETETAPSMLFICPTSNEALSVQQYWSTKLVPLGVSLDSGNNTGGTIAHITICDGSSIPQVSKSFDLVFVESVQRMTHLAEAVIPVIASKRRYIFADSTDIRSLNDLAKWAGVSDVYMLSSHLRACPLQVRIETFAHRMRDSRFYAMIRPAYLACLNKDSQEGYRSIIVVDSKRNMKLLAESFVSLAVNDGNPYCFCGTAGVAVGDSAKDGALRTSLSFGIALLHPHLVSSDALLAVNVFGSGLARVLVSTVDALLSCSSGNGFPIAERMVLCGISFGHAHKGRQNVTESVRTIQTLLGQVQTAARESPGQVVALVSDENRTLAKHALTCLTWPVETHFTELHKFADYMLLNPQTIGMNDAFSTSIRKDTLVGLRLESNPAFYGLANGTHVLINQHLVSKHASALDLLHLYKAVDASCEITPKGHAVAKLGLSCSSLESIQSLCAEETYASLAALTGGDVTLLALCGAISALEKWQVTFAACVKAMDGARHCKKRINGRTVVRRHEGRLHVSHTERVLLLAVMFVNGIIQASEIGYAIDMEISGLRNALVSLYDARSLTLLQSINI